jgi:Ca-activated chloride channel family protein
MFHFANPSYLLLALAVPPLLWWWLRQRGGALRYPTTGALAGLPAGRGKWARYGGAGLRALALLLLVAALAGPRWPDRRTRIDTEGIAIEMVVDVSGSMAEADFDWDGLKVERLEAVRRSFDLFVAGGDADGNHFDGRGNDLIGLVTFATRPESPCPLTLSHSVLLKMLKDERPRSIPGESETNVSDALILGLHRLHAAGPRRKVLILLSDGEHNVTPTPSGMTPRQAAQVAGNLGVRVYCIDAGGDGSPVPEPGGRDGSPVLEPGARADTLANRAEGARTLQEVAHITGGRYFSARDTKALLAVWRDIDAMERSDIVSFQYRRYYEGFAYFALAALIVWLLVGALEQTFWQRIP